MHLPLLTNQIDLAGSIYLYYQILSMTVCGCVARILEHFFYVDATMIKG